jgi:hypothetical protein
MSNPVVISGIFSDPNGVPVPGAKIVIQSQVNTVDTFKKLSIGVETDSTGAYSFSLLPGGYTAVVLYPEGNRVVLGEFTLQNDSPAGSLNDYLLFGEPVLADPVVYSDIKKIYERIMVSAAVVKTSADSAEQSELAAAAQAESAKASAVQADADETKTQALFVQCQNILTAIQTASVTDKVFFNNPPDDPDGTIAGMSGTTDGEGFFVSQGANSDPAFKFYIHTGSTAVLWATLPGGKNSLNFADTGAVNALVISGQTLTAGNLITVTGIAATNTGPATIAINGAAPVAITAMGGGALQGNEWTAGGDIVLVITANGATLTGTTGGNLPVLPGTASGHAATVGQLNSVSGAALKTANNLNEIAAAGAAAQTAARANLGITPAAGALLTANNLSEIATEGAAAQAAARNNLGAQQNGQSLLTANNLSEIASAGTAAQASARSNIGATDGTGLLKTSNNLSEISAEGVAAQLAARNNLGVPAPSTFLQTANDLSEIAAAGTAAQLTARTNIGATDGTGLLKTANNLSEIAANGPAAQTSARTNINAQQAGVSLLTVNSLSEIAAAGTAAQTSARTNIGAEQTGLSLLIANNLSEIASAGTAAQLAAQANLGINAAGAGSGSGFLAVTVFTGSGTFSPTPKTTHFLIKMCSGGSGSYGVVDGTSTSYYATPPGYPGFYAEILFTSLAPIGGTFAITIGAGGAAGVGNTAPTFGGNTSIVQNSTGKILFETVNGTLITGIAGIVESSFIPIITNVPASVAANQGSVTYDSSFSSGLTLLKVMDCYAGLVKYCSGPCGLTGNANGNKFFSTPNEICSEMGVIGLPNASFSAYPGAPGAGISGTGTAGTAYNGRSGNAGAMIIYEY